LPTRGEVAGTRHDLEGWELHARAGAYAETLEQISSRELELIHATVVGTTFDIKNRSVYVGPDGEDSHSCDDALRLRPSHRLTLRLAAVEHRAFRDAAIGALFARIDVQASCASTGLLQELHRAIAGSWLSASAGSSAESHPRPGTCARLSSPRR
jgi:hypothetical protein